MEYLKRFTDGISSEVVLLSAFQFLHALQILFLYMQCVETPVDPMVDKFCFLSPLFYIEIILSIVLFSRHVVVFLGVIMVNIMIVFAFLPVFLYLSLPNLSYLSILLVSMCILILIFTPGARQAFLYYPDEENEPEKS